MIKLLLFFTLAVDLRRKIREKTLGTDAQGTGYVRMVGALNAYT